MKKYQNIVSFLISVAVLFDINTIYTVYSFLNSKRLESPIDSNTFLIILSGVLILPVISFIFRLIGLVFVLKNKKVGYLISGVLSFYTFYNGISQIIKNNIDFTLTMTIFSVFWITLTILSFMVFLRLNKETTLPLANK